MQMLFKLLQRVGEKRKHPNYFYKANITFIPKSGKGSTPTKLQTNVTQILMWKNLNNILANRIKDYIKNKKSEYIMTKQNLF